MKKQILKIAFVSALSAIALLAGCEKPCEHTGGTATCTEPAVCELCGESYGEALGHSHATTWTYNETKHWNECACGDKANEADHNWIAGEITTQPTCTTVGQQNYACECGATKVEELPIQHEYATEWTAGETTHWKECECGAKSEETAHEYTIKDADELEHWTKCVCGAESEHIEHEFPEEGTVITAATGCKGDNSKYPIVTNAGKMGYACACGYSYEEAYYLPHVDADKDCTCDYNNDDGNNDKSDGLYKCTARVMPEDQSRISIAYATAATVANSKVRFFVEGTVIAIHGVGIYGVQDATGVILVRIPGNQDGVAHADWGYRLCIGDTVEIYGKPKKNSFSTADYNSTVYPACYDGNTVDETSTTANGSKVKVLNHTHSYSEATCTVPATCGCGSVNGTTIPHPDTDTNNKCDICSYPIGTTMASTLISTKPGNDGCGTLNGTTSWNWDLDQFTFEVNKGTASSVDTNATREDHIRLRSNNTITVTAKNENTFKRIVIVSTSSSYVENLKKALESVTGATVVVDGTRVIVDFDTPVTTITAKAGGSTRIAAVEVYY